MEDGFVKEPAVVTRENFLPGSVSLKDLELIKLTDGVRLHESVKAELEAYAVQNDVPLVKPFILIIARDTKHAAEISSLIRSADFFDGRYADKLIQVDSTAREDETIARLLQVEKTYEPTEIVVHVNMLKEGWDVTNLYTIVPLRPANARVLIEQSIGRGLRLPYGARTGVTAIDRLNIVAHDRFQEIIDEARKPNSRIRLQTVILEDDFEQNRSRTIISRPALDFQLGFAEPQPSGFVNFEPLFKQSELAAARLVHDAVHNLGDDPLLLPDIAALRRPEIQERLAANILPELDASVRRDDVARIVAQTVKSTIDLTIGIPQISIAPAGGSSRALKPFQLDRSNLSFPPPVEDLWIAHLRTGQTDRIAATYGQSDRKERYEDRILTHLIAHDDIAYEDGPDVLYDLAAQAVHHLQSYLDDEAVGRVTWVHGSEIASDIRRQILEHAVPFRQDVYVANVASGFSPSSDCLYGRRRSGSNRFQAAAIRQAQDERVYFLRLLALSLSLAEVSLRP